MGGQQRAGSSIIITAATAVRNAGRWCLESEVQVVDKPAMGVFGCAVKRD